MYPVLIEGQRLSLRELEPTDTAAVLASTADPSATKHLPFTAMDDDEVASYIKELIDAATEPERFLYPLAIVRHDDQQVIGLAQLGIESFVHRRAELGYLLGSAYWGQGFGSEAVSLITEFGFDHLGLQRIFAVAATGNQASKRLLDSQGFHLEGTLRDHLLLGDKWVDGELFARVAARSGIAEAAPNPARS